jgi:RimJ/RimL family protein N-acetyltransferase
MIAPILHTERLTLRPLSEADFPRLTEFYESDRSLHVGGPQRPEQTWRSLAAEIGHWTLRGYGRFGVDETATGEFVGIVGPWNPFGWPEPELGWDLMNGFEGKGFATEAAIATRDYAYTTLGWPTAISLVADGNEASAHVAKRCGAVWESKYIHARFGEMSVYRHLKPEASQ